MRTNWRSSLKEVPEAADCESVTDDQRAPIGGEASRPRQIAEAPGGRPDRRAGRTGATPTRHRRGRLPRVSRGWASMALAAVTVVSLMAGLTGLAVAQSTRAVTDQVTARAHDATAAAQSAVEGRIAVIVQLVSSYAERPDISARVAATDHVVFGPRTALTDALGELHATVPGLVSAWITDERGIIVDTYEHNPATIGQDLSFRDWYQGARRGRRAVPLRRLRQQGSRPDPRLRPQRPGPCPRRGRRPGRRRPGRLDEPAGARGDVRGRGPQLRSHADHRSGRSGPGQSRRAPRAAGSEPGRPRCPCRIAGPDAAAPWRRLGHRVGTAELRVDGQHEPAHVTGRRAQPSADADPRGGRCRGGPRP